MTSKIDALRVLDDLGAVRNRCPTKRFNWYALEACRPFESAEHDEDGGPKKAPCTPL
ncbi:hypothetical protein FXW36_03580 (plasmid) [Rhodococcus opacus]|uniref:hypothetical protein n=1 Tax=Rhodococcus opacus TaxID=37919 RepID=UPI0016040C85|nr:hypothetical protein [Rhodococcus opacus]QZS52670.1 hypothetical protein FXW36_03580 [Rhodococcus opacus]